MSFLPKPEAKLARFQIARRLGRVSKNPKGVEILKVL